MKHIVLVTLIGSLSILHLDCRRVGITSEETQHTITTQINAGLPSLGLVAYYPFNGNANDASGNGNDGIVHGATLTDDRFNVPQSAYAFDGISNSIDCGSSPLLSPDSAITISAWIFLVPNSQAQAIVSHGDNSYAMYVEISKYLNWAKAKVNNISPDSAATAITARKWHHVLAINRIGIDVELYIDGVQKVHVPFSLTYSYSKHLTLGYTDSDALPFDGSIDDVRIYNRALSTDEIQALYHEGGWTGN